MFAWFTSLLLLLCIFGIMVMMIVSRISVTINQARLRLLNSNRGEMSKEDFIHYFVRKGYSDTAVAFLYHEIQKNLTRRSYALHPDDNLHRDYFLHRDYLREVAIRTFRAAWGKSPDIAQEKLLNTKGSADTFEKILSFVELENSQVNS